MEILKEWQPESWMAEKICCLPQYDLTAAKKVVADLRQLPALVNKQAVDALHLQLSSVVERKSFLLQVGDCAEKMSEKDFKTVSQKVNFMRILADKIPQVYETILVGRIAGQYAKPRSVAFETHEGKSLPAYQGDLINQIKFSSDARMPNPDLMHLAYQSAQETLANIELSLSHKKNMFFTSHEALQLFYEEALTRCVHGTENWYNLSTHFPWLGMRTAMNSQAHIEYLRGIQNPIAIKLGPLMTAERLLELIHFLNPSNIPGRITLIHRLGHEKISAHLPLWIHAVQRQAQSVVWCCDPMHGNTEVLANGIKTRRLSRIMSEVEQAFQIHQDLNSFLGGIHLEVTPKMVTECIDDELVFEDQLMIDYQTTVDPRLNPIQAFQVMNLVHKKLLRM